MQVRGHAASKKYFEAAFPIEIGVRKWLMAIVNALVSRSAVRISGVKFGCGGLFPGGNLMRVQVSDGNVSREMRIDVPFQIA